MRNKAAILTALAFLVAAGLSYLMALAVGLALQSRSERHVARALGNAGLDWVEVSADGLLVTLKGTAPSEAMRYRASIVAGRVVGASRVLDELDVTPSKPLTAPRFSLELLRNDDGVSVIGLAPESWDTGPFLAAGKILADEDLTNMVETADFPQPEHWEEAIAFGLEAMRLLPRSKISIAADLVKVDAIADSQDQKHAFESALSRVVPRNVPVQVQISAPRAVIAPFTLRFVMENGAARFDACSADTERARTRITAAGRRAGVPGAPVCVLGLGVPSLRWAEAAELLIGAMKELGAGSVTISDVDVTLIAESSVAQADFDRVVGELTTKLPDVFSLKATLTPKPLAEGQEGLAQFTAILSEAGQIQLRGRLSDERMRTMVEAFARARFGADQVYMAARLDEQLPPTWGTRVLAGLSALAELSNGSVLVTPDAVTVRGVTGNTGASAEISRLLSDHLGQGASYKVDVTYNERLDPSRGLPSPQECLARAEEVLSARQISFAPNSDEVVGEAARVVSTLAEELEDCAGARLEIGGHTDSQGRAESNLALSQRRAEAVLNGLAQRGIDTSMMSAKGYGAAEPIADNATEEGRVANRRIAFKLLTVPGAQPIDSVVSPEDPEDDGEAISSIRPPSRPEALEDAEQTSGSEEAPTRDAPATLGETAPMDDEATVVPELDEGEAPMGDAGDLLVGPDGEPIIDPEDPAEAVSEEDLMRDAAEGTEPAAPQQTRDAAPQSTAPNTETTVEAPAAPAPETASEGVPSSATGAEPAPDGGSDASPAASTTETVPSPAPVDGSASTEAPVATETVGDAEAPSNAPPAGTATPGRPAMPGNPPALLMAPTPQPAPAEGEEPALPWSEAEPGELPELRPQFRPGGFAPAAPEALRGEATEAAPLPLPAGWDLAPDLPDLRPLQRPKELAQ